MNKMIVLTASLAAIVAVVMVLKQPQEKEPGEESNGRNEYVTIKGSDTMVHLLSSWVEAFMSDHPEAEFSVTGGGSGTGFAALLGNITDICAASRPIREKEIKLAEQKGIDPKEFIVARDGIVLIIHQDNPVNTLTLEQIRKIYTGAYTSWAQAGGPDEKILLLSRESSSGTYAFFQEHILKKDDYAVSARLMPATSTIIQSVSTDRWAIGYVGLGYAAKAAGKVKTVGIKKNNQSQAVFPTEQTVRNKTYSISRPLYLYTNGSPTGRLKQFIDFTSSQQGRRITSETGYIPID